MRECSRSSHGRHTPVAGYCIGCGEEVLTPTEEAARKPFGEVFEREPRPLVSLRRLTDEEKAAANLPSDNTVGLFQDVVMIGCFDFTDLFDENGNYFYND